MATLSFKNINKIYDNNVQAVFDFNLEVADKEFIVFVGPSGCGKSTTLRMIAGLEDITAGELFIDGRLVNNIVPKDRDIAMVFQSYALYPHMTVYNNMAFALKLRKIPLPVYEPNTEVDAIMEQNKALRGQIAKLNRKIKKQNEAPELLEQRDFIYQQIVANNEKIASLQVQVLGKDEYTIKNSEKTIAVIQKEIASNEKLLAKATDEEQVSVLTEANVQKTKQIEDLQAKIEFLNTNDVPLNKVRHMRKDEIDVAVYTTAKTLDLSRYLFRKPAALSGGQRQRVALGRAIVRNPKVFLMDEPLSNLDAKLRVQMRSEIAKIHKRVGATTIYVTHDQTEAMTMANRIVIMKDGYIQQIGTPEEVYNDPANTFVAGFIGSPAMNFLKGHYASGKFVVSNEETSYEIALDKKAKDLLKDYEEKDIILGARPEKVFIAGDAGNENPGQKLELTCDFSELLGYELVLYTYIAGQRFMVKTNTKAAVKTGDQFKLCFNNNELYFFDAETTMRIK